MYIVEVYYKPLTVEYVVRIIYRLFIEHTKAIVRIIAIRIYNYSKKKMLILDAYEFYSSYAQMFANT